MAVMRDKNSGRSRGFAFVTFVVDETTNPEDPAKGVKDLNAKMLNPVEPHLV